ncbi:hypothetical protein VCHA53O466_50280 [Vibrio chagasii]|nr:hypothetical protein VCHA53O466_50280 [Vibrio chagasii]
MVNKLLRVTEYKSGNILSALAWCEPVSLSNGMKCYSTDMGVAVSYGGSTTLFTNNMDALTSLGNIDFKLYKEFNDAVSAPVNRFLEDRSCDLLDIPLPLGRKVVTWREILNLLKKFNDLDGDKLSYQEVFDALNGILGDAPYSVRSGAGSSGYMALMVINTLVSAQVITYTGVVGISITKDTERNLVELINSVGYPFLTMFAHNMRERPLYDFSEA